jgi:hypothetical protein
MEGGVSITTKRNNSADLQSNNRDVRAGLRVRVLPRLTSYQIYRSNFVVLGFDRPMSLSTIYLAMCVSEMDFFYPLKAPKMPTTRSAWLRRTGPRHGYLGKT